MCSGPRAGFKTGAAPDMAFATGRYRYYFDADFLPAPDFLLKTQAGLTAGGGVVQTLGEYINAKHSLPSNDGSLSNSDRPN